MNIKVPKIGLGIYLLFKRMSYSLFIPISVFSFLCGLYHYFSYFQGKKMKPADK